MRKHPPLTEEQEKVFRAHCSARSDVLMPSDYVNTATNDDDSLVSGGMDEETWDLVKILSVADVTGSCPVVCQTEGCGLKAGVIYVSSSGLKWYGCLDCQVGSFFHDGRTHPIRSSDQLVSPAASVCWLIKGYGIRRFPRTKRNDQSHPHRRAGKGASQALFQESHACNARRVDAENGTHESTA